MKNAIFWALVGVVAVFLGLIAYGVYLSVTHASAFDVVTSVCAGFLLVSSLLVWELLMKPGYYRRRRGSEPEELERGPEGSGPAGRPPSR